MQNTWCVTGGAGFIGSNFVRRTLEHTDLHLVIIDKLTYAGSLANLSGVLDQPRVRFTQADIADESAMQQVATTERPSAVVNFAAETHVDRSIDHPGGFVQTNVVGTSVLLEVYRRYHAGLAADDRARFRFLHVSTDEVYGTRGPEGLFSETTPYAPNSPYSATKAAADHLVRAYHHTYALPVLVTNCSNNYGPYQFPEKLIPLTILNAAAGRPLPIYGNGSNIRDWLHVDDHCDAVRLVLERGVVGEHYNIGGRNERTNLEVVTQICHVLDRVRPPHADPLLRERGITSYAQLRTFVPDRPGHDQRYAIDAAKITESLGWRAAHTFDTGIEQTVQWYLTHGDWCDLIRSRYSGHRLGLGMETVRRTSF